MPEAINLLQIMNKINKFNFTSFDFSVYTKYSSKYYVKVGYFSTRSVVNA